MAEKLKSEEGSFFELVRQAVAANPFSETRAVLDQQIAGRCGQDPGERPVEDALREVRACLDQLDGQRYTDIRLYSGDDQKQVQNAVLFDLFHRLIPPFDQLISDQLNSGDENLQVPFASDATDRLVRRGFTTKEANRYFSLFFHQRLYCHQPFTIFRDIDRVGIVRASQRGIHRGHR